jgi:hypothetical protein
MVSPAIETAYMRYDQVFLHDELAVTKYRGRVTYLDIHHIVNTNRPQFWELRSALCQKRANIVSLLALPVSALLCPGSPLPLFGAQCHPNTST